jgi:hypothetical protein
MLGSGLRSVIATSDTQIRETNRSDESPRELALALFRRNALLQSEFSE